MSSSPESSQNESDSDRPSSKISIIKKPGCVTIELVSSRRNPWSSNTYIFFHFRKPFLKKDTSNQTGFSWGRWFDSFSKWVRWIFFLESLA